MIRKRLGRIATIFTSAVLATMVLGVGSISAAPPRWTMTVVQLPQTVGPNANAGFRITIQNNGPSNISSLFLVSDLTAQPTYISTPSQGTCNATGRLFCSFGSLTPPNTVTVTVAYKVGTGAFKVAFQGNSNGATYSDTKGRSHGDTLEPDPAVTTTAVSSSSNFDGGFVVDDSLYQTTGTLGRQNKQTSTVEVTDTFIPVTVADGGVFPDPTCTGADCAGGFGEWTYLKVPGNHNLIKVTLMVWGGAVDGGTDVDQIYVLHVDDLGVTTTISAHCDPATGTPGNPECLTATKVGSNYRIIVWLNGNGSARGGF